MGLGFQAHMRGRIGIGRDSRPPVWGVPGQSAALTVSVLVIRDGAGWRSVEQTTHLSYAGWFEGLTFRTVANAALVIKRTSEGPDMQFRQRGAVRARRVLRSCSPQPSPGPDTVLGYRRCRTTPRGGVRSFLAFQGREGPAVHVGHTAAAMETTAQWP